MFFILYLYFQKILKGFKDLFRDLITLDRSILLEKPRVEIPIDINVTIKKRIVIDCANDEDVVGSIKLFAGSTPPKSWKICDGSLLLICNYPDLYRVIGCIYGGDGRTTFALPDMRGRVAVGSGKGDNLTHRHLSESYGTETIYININQLPLEISENVSRSGRPAQHQSVTKITSHSGINNMQPSLTLNYIICCEGRPLIL
jgi:microcystin-dependent protein